MDPWLALAVVAGMVLAGTLLLNAIGAKVKAEPLIAIARAGLQLAALVLILKLVFTSIWLVLFWLCVMLVVAILTSAKRIGWSMPVLKAAAAAIATSAVITVGIIFATGITGRDTQHLLAIGGILIGNVMSITSVTAKRLREHLQESRDEIEGMLALGATPRQAAARFRGLSVSHALIPTIDSTSTTGLVTLPGAFVGALFAGSDPLDAGLFQLVVLGSILFGGAIAGTVVTQLLGAPKVLPQPPREAKESSATK